MPIRGGRICRASSFATFSSIISAITAKHPASSKAIASVYKSSASWRSPPNLRYPPIALTVWGSNPICPRTGIPVATNFSISSATSRPPSIFTASAPPSCIKLRADCRRRSKEKLASPKGRSATSKQFGWARRTAAVWRTISVISTGMVVL